MFYLVPGSWLPWGEYGRCSKSCDQGVQVRYRNCSIPYPPGAGDNCTVGDERNTTTCKYADCPGECKTNGKQTRISTFMVFGVGITKCSQKFFNVDVNFVTNPNKLDSGNLKTTMKSSKC